ncbi:hypothetical protein SteCoe_36137 [Stentor coeruleus]|uniref:Cyclin-dependent kinase inhibitor domain-containing protein n=1 Tax=Stentor coeruleus TaxID=5963 RepID=A0A1R2AQR3_9CILI|nr:hypothetical protein SteCoe_36137 [Stentor coeruleus]
MSDSTQNSTFSIGKMPENTQTSTFSIESYITSLKNELSQSLQIKTQLYDYDFTNDTPLQSSKYKWENISKVNNIPNVHLYN